MANKNSQLLKACKNNDLEKVMDAFKGHSTWYETHIEAADVNCQESGDIGDTPLIIAARLGHRDIVNFLLSKGAQPNKKNKKGLTAIMAAANTGRIDIIEDIVAKKGDINERDNDGAVALHYATAGCQGQCTIYLLSKGCDPNSKMNSGNTPLHNASAGNVDLISMEALIDKDADIDARRNDGVTPLMLAAQSGKDPAVEVLISSGANTDIRLSDGRRAVNLSATDDIKKILLNPLEAKMRAAFARHKLDPEKKQQWMTIGNDAVEHVVGGLTAPKILVNSFNFAARQFTTYNHDLLTDKTYPMQSGSMDVFPDQELLQKGHQVLIDRGLNPPDFTALKIAKLRAI